MDRKIFRHRLALVSMGNFKCQVGETSEVASRACSCRKSASALRPVRRQPPLQRAAFPIVITIDGLPPSFFLLVNCFLSWSSPIVYHVVSASHPRKPSHLAIRNASFIAATSFDDGQSKGEETASHHAQTLHPLLHSPKLNAQLLKNEIAW